MIGWGPALSRSASCYYYYYYYYYSSKQICFAFIIPKKGVLLWAPSPFVASRANADCGVPRTRDFACRSQLSLSCECWPSCGLKKTSHACMPESRPNANASAQCACIHIYVHSSCRLRISAHVRASATRAAAVPPAAPGRPALV
jgi:hypothetical protein